MHIIEFVKVYWLDIVFVLMIGLLIVIMWRKGMKKELLGLARRAVLMAEEHLGSKTGQAKKAEAVALIYSWLPASLRLFVSQAMVDHWIEEAVKWLHKQMEEGGPLERRLCGTLLIEGCVDEIKPQVE